MTYAQALAKARELLASQVPPGSEIYKLGRTWHWYPPLTSVRCHGCPRDFEEGELVRHVLARDVGRSHRGRIYYTVHVGDLEP